MKAAVYHLKKNTITGKTDGKLDADRPMENFTKIWY